MDDPNTPATPQPASPQEQAAQPPTTATPDGEAALRDLAMRLLDPGRFNPDAAAPQPQLLVGQVAPDFPFAPPLPEGGRIVGSYPRGDTTTVVLDVPLESLAAWDYYRTQVALLGWQMEVEFDPRGQGGFVQSTSMARTFSRFFREDADPMLTVTAVDAPAGRSTVLLAREPATPGGRFKNPMAQRHMGRPRMWSVLPVIQAPPLAQQSPEGSSGNDRKAIASASLETDLDFVAVAAHYRAQFEQGGWRRLDGGESDPVAWSSWSFTDEQGEPWSALFVLLRRPDLANRYYLTIRAEWVGTALAGPHGQSGAPPVGPTHTGWTTYGP